MAPVRAESARAARDCDLRSRVRVARPRVAACAVPVPTAGFPSRRVLARSVERSAPRLGPGSVQHARLAGACREPRPTLSVARRAARAVARVSRDGGLAAGARLPPREGRRSLRPANQVALAAAVRCTSPIGNTIENAVRRLVGRAARVVGGIVLQERGDVLTLRRGKVLGERGVVHLAEVVEKLSAELPFEVGPRLVVLVRLVLRQFLNDLSQMDDAALAE